MPIKTKGKQTKKGVDIFVDCPRYIESPDKKLLEIKPFNLVLQVSVPSKASNAELKSIVICKKEAAACQAEIKAELDNLKGKVAEAKQKESGGDTKAADGANKVREKSLDKIQDLLADSRISMRQSIAAVVKLKPKDIQTVGRGIFGSKAIQFPKGLFKNLSVDKKAATSFGKSIDDLSDLADKVETLKGKEEAQRQALARLKGQDQEALKNDAQKIRKDCDEYTDTVRTLLKSGEAVMDINKEVVKLAKGLGPDYQTVIKRQMRVLLDARNKFLASARPREGTIVRMKEQVDRLKSDRCDWSKWSKHLEVLVRHGAIDGKVADACRALEPIAKKAKKAAAGKS